MKRLLTIFTLLFFSITAKSQLDKGIWLVGGVGNFSASKGETTYPIGILKYTSSNISVLPNIGYFITDKFAAGIKTGFTWDKYTGGDVLNNGVIVASGGSSNVKRFDIGTFVRYYFLEKEKQFNLLVEANYLHGFINQGSAKGNGNTFSINAGPVIYFNSSVGIEFLLGYRSRTEDINGGLKDIKNSFQIGIGFQVHLENL